MTHDVDPVAVCGRSSQVELAAGRFHYRRWAAPAGAPRAILLHGNGSTWMTWSRVGPALCAAGWETFALDLRGCGSSVRPPVGRYGLAEVAADVHDFMDALEIRDPVLIGHCWGAAVAVCLATGAVTDRVPPGLRGLVLEEFPADMSSPAQQPAVQDYQRMMRSPREYVENWVDLVCRSWHPLDRQSLLEDACGADVDAYLSTIRDGADAGSLLPLLARLEVPALVLRGNPRRGGILNDKDWHLLRQHLPDHCTARELADGGHELHRGDYQTFMRFVSEFLPPAAPA
jgi:pimeloyl-ACP methyl ester carboxylesterase